MTRKKEKPGPDMSGVAQDMQHKDDWDRLLDMRRETMKPQVSTSNQVPGDVVKSRRHDVTGDITAASAYHDGPAGTTRQARPGRRSAPRAADAVALTIRFDPDEMPDVDALVLALRSETGTRVDKSQIVRELLRMAFEDGSTTRKALIHRLKS